MPPQSFIATANERVDGLRGAGDLLVSRHSKPLFEALLASFAREAGAGRDILLALDNAGWHGEAGVAIPDGVRLVFQLAYSPELQPAENLWQLVDEPIANQHIPGR